MVDPSFPSPPKHRPYISAKDMELHLVRDIPAERINTAARGPGDKQRSSLPIGTIETTAHGSRDRMKEWLLGLDVDAVDVGEAVAGYAAADCGGVAPIWAEILRVAYSRRSMRIGDLCAEIDALQELKSVEAL